MSTDFGENNRRNRKRRASEALEDPPKPAFDISRIPIEKLWEIFTPTFRRYVELRWPGQDVDEKLRSIRANTSSEEIISLAKMGPAVLTEWRANTQRSGLQQPSGSADTASERSSTAVATISSDTSSNTRRSATIIPDPQPQPTSFSSGPLQAVHVAQAAGTLEVEDVEMADAAPDPVPISNAEPVASLPSVVQPALVSVPVPIPAPVTIATPQAMVPAAPMAVAPSISLHQTSSLNVDLDPDVDQAIIYELRDRTTTETFILKQDNAKATSAYMWTMRSHAFDPEQEYTCYKLRSFETAAVKALFAQLPPNADDKMRAQAIARLPTTWPTKGRVLFVEINKEKSKAYGPKDFTPPTESIDITHDIHEGTNPIKFAQLSDQSAWTFAVFERRPYREELEAARQLAG